MSDILDLNDEFSFQDEKGEKVEWRVVNFKNTNYFLKINSISYRTGLTRQYKHYRLYNAGLFQIANMIVALKDYPKKAVERYKEKGYINFYEKMYELDSIEIEEEFQNQEIGSFLLNLVMIEIEKSGLPLRITRLTTKQNKRFYEKWGGEHNRLYDSDEDNELCELIVKSPRPNERYIMKKICPKKIIKGQLEDKTLFEDFSCENDEKGELK